MSFMNRKMFNRNARNKLNAMGGIRTLANGGLTISRMNPAINYGGPSLGEVNPLAKTQFQSIGNINQGVLNQLISPNRTDAEIKKQLQEKINKSAEPFLNRFLPDPNVIPKTEGEAFRQNLLTTLFPRFKKPSVSPVDVSEEKFKRLTPFGMQERAKEALDVGIMTLPSEMLKADPTTQKILDDQKRMQEGQISPVLQEQKDVAEEENLIAGQDPDKKKIIKPTITEEQQKILDDQKRRQVGQLGTILPKTKEEIAKVINEGTDKEKQDELKQLMQEFTQNAPQYEGLDKGLAIAKIGFAMAAGQSPDAITNIAKALEGGADMFIKDKKQRDDFNRQVQLSALKYGLQEKSKIASENRLIAKERRGFKDYVVGPGGTTYRGKRYEANETIPVNIGDIRDGNLPDNLFADSTIAALLKEKAAYNKLLSDARKNKTIKPTELTKQLTDYNKAVSDAIDAESGMALIEGAMITVSEGGVTGISGAVSDMIKSGGAFFGMDLSKNYGSKAEVQNAMRAALQKTIPVTLGRTQSANSISNRDVDFLITAYFGQGALEGGPLSFVTTNDSEMLIRLQRAHEQMQNAQKGAFAQIKTTEAFLSPLIQPGTNRSAAGLLSADRTRLAEVGLAPGGEEGFGTYVGGKKVVRQIGATRGDDGVIRLDLSK